MWTESAHRSVPMELDFLDDEETIPRALEQRYPVLFTVVARDVVPLISSLRLTLATLL
jgi:hypothetical protein